MQKTRKHKKHKLRAFTNKFKRLKQKSMSFFNRGRRSFGRRSFGRPRFSRPMRPRFRSYRRNSIPLVGRFIPRSIQPLVILAALVGGAWYFFKEPLKAMIDKIKNHTA